LKHLAIISAEEEVARIDLFQDAEKFPGICRYWLEAAVKTSLAKRGWRGLPSKTWSEWDCSSRVTSTIEPDFIALRCATSVYPEAGFPIAVEMICPKMQTIFYPEHPTRYH
jgi:hypothetical protein